jgi:hypothetical protein
MPIPALKGKDIDGSVTSFTLLTLPANGKMYVNGTAINALPGAGMVITPLQATQLSFDPNDNFNSIASFTFTVTDNNNNTDATAEVYMLYVNVPPVTQNVAHTGLAANQAATVIAGLIGNDDVAVSFYTITSLPDPAAGILYINSTAVTSLSQVSNISPAQAAQLRFATSANFKGALFTYTATDNLGIIDVTPAVYVLSSASGILPVKLISFAGLKSDNDNLVIWSTSIEINTSRFEIEHSIDGLKFANIGSIAAKGNSTVKTDYLFTHCNVTSGMHYYRLRTIDKDGGYSLSNIIMLNRDANSSLLASVMPNPFVQQLMVTYQSEANTVAGFKIYDASGKLIKQVSARVFKGINMVQIDGLSNLHSGTYFLVVIDGENKSKSQLIKL